MISKTLSMKELLCNIKGGTILDVAAGAGNFAFMMEKYFLSTNFIVAIDTAISPLIHISNNIETKKIKPIVMSGNLLGFKANTFDTVAISNSLHHLQSPKITLREMCRTLVPGGHFIIKEMFYDGDQTPAQKTHTLLHNWWAAVDAANNVTHNPVFTEEELKNQINSINLTNTMFYNNEDTSTDPFEPEMIEYMNKALDRYTKRIKNNKEQTIQGKIAREHLEEFGFCSARSLVAIGKKCLV